MGGAIPTLAGVGIGAGARVLWCTLLSEAAHFWPLFIGTMLGGAQFSLADATAPDALRVGMFVRRLEYRAVMGVNEAVLDGFDELGRPYAEVFGAVPVVGARPGAYERLRAVGLAPHWFVLCGPAVAIAVEPGGPARVDPAEWTLHEDGGRILVTSRLPARDDLRPHADRDPRCARRRPLVHPRDRSSHVTTRTLKDRAAMVGVGATPYYRRGRSLPQTTMDLAIKATLAALDDAGLAVEDVDGFALYGGNFVDTSLLAQVLGIPSVRFTAGLTGGGGGSAGSVGLAAASGRDRDGRCGRVSS